MLVMLKTKSYVICTNWDFELVDWGGGRGRGRGVWILLSVYNCLDIDNEKVNCATREKLR